MKIGGGAFFSQLQGKELYERPASVLDQISNRASLPPPNIMNVGPMATKTSVLKNLARQPYIRRKGEDYLLKS